jgi:hypothetical protein
MISYTLISEIYFSSFLSFKASSNSFRSKETLVFGSLPIPHPASIQQKATTHHALNEHTASTKIKRKIPLVSSIVSLVSKI